VDVGLDSSNWTPWALERLLDVALRLSFAEASLVLKGFGLNISPAELERLSASYSYSLETKVAEHLQALALQPLSENESENQKLKQVEGQLQGSVGLAGSQGRALVLSRLMILEVDGVRVSGQPDAQTHQCEGIEIKAALIYPYQSPFERSRLAGVMSADQLLPRVSGLLRQAGVRTQDSLIGVSDGAVWIEQLYQTLGIPQIIDVFHATQYLDTVMIQLGWSEVERHHERNSWLRGEINAGQWLKTFCPPPTAPDRQTWSDEAKTAIQYLEQRQDRMNYQDYKAKGWPIGSGQVEGMNKHVIGSRMKGSGMHWSRPGASRMAAWRAHAFSIRPIASFAQLRRIAFPICLS